MEGAFSLIQIIGVINREHQHKYSPNRRSPLREMRLVEDFDVEMDSGEPYIVVHIFGSQSC